MTAREANQPKNQVGLNRYLSPLGAWALAFGCAVGWGAFVMPGNLFLPEAGPLGTVLAMLIGAAIMILIGVNYYYMMQRYPDAGGAFTYTKKELGYDHGFLSAWFLMLTYVSIIWANATALALLGGPTIAAGSPAVWFSLHRCRLRRVFRRGSVVDGGPGPDGAGLPGRR